MALSVVTIGAFLVENLLYFPLSVPYMKDLAAGAPLLDMRFGYTPDAAWRLFEVLGQNGRDNYLKLLWTIDILLPALFALFLILRSVGEYFTHGDRCPFWQRCAITWRTSRSRCS